MEEFKRSDDKVLSGMTSTALFEYVHSLEDTVASLSNNVANLTEQIRIMNERTYGRKTETAAVLDMPQLDLGLNEAESLADEKEPEPVLEEAAPKKKKAKGKKATDLQKITNHRDEYIELTDEELNKKYGEGKWKHLPYEIINMQGMMIRRSSVHHIQQNCSRNPSRHLRWWHPSCMQSM
jgi:regulator of replication initiation timing